MASTDEYSNEEGRVCKRAAAKDGAYIRRWSPMLVLVLAMAKSLYGVQAVEKGNGRLPANTAQSSPAQRALARAESAALDRRYGDAARILREVLRGNPGDTALQLELGRIYLLTDRDAKARRLFEQILKTEPENRWARLELARTLGNQQHYGPSNELYRHLLLANPADEPAAIGLASNLMHEGRRIESASVVDASLRYHPNSLRLLELKDRITQGLLGGEEENPIHETNTFSTVVDYVDDSAGNHAWRVSELLELRVSPGLTNELNLEQQMLHGLDDRFELVQTYLENVHWRPMERMAITAGGGTVRFYKGDVHAIYGTTVSGQLGTRLVLGGGFSRIPIVPDAEAAEHRLTAQGWEAFGTWSPGNWQVSLRASRSHYSDENVGAFESAEALGHGTSRKITYLAGARFRRFGFSQDVSHGYFSPNNYQSYQATFGATLRPNRRYRGEILTRSGAESIASGADFQAAWELDVRNRLALGRSELHLDYSMYHMAQSTGAFKALAGLFEFIYHF